MLCLNMLVPRLIKRQFIVSFALFIATTALLYSKFGYYNFAAYKPRPAFWDLNNHTYWWNCYKTVGLDVFLSTSSLLDACRNFNYGYFSMFSMGLTTSIYGNVMFWGLLQVLVFLFLVVKVYFHKLFTSREYVYLLALFSPGVFLLYLSGNMDIQIICLLLLANKLIFSGKEKFGLTLIFITALLKFYTAPVLLVAFFIVKVKSSRTYCIMLIFSAATLILFQLIKTPLAPFPDSAQNKFGSGIFDNYARKAGLPLNKFQGELLGLIFLCAVILLIIVCYKKLTPLNKNNQIKLSKSKQMLSFNFLMMAATSLACYLGGLNVDYRLTFIALTGIALLQIPQTKVKIISAIFPYVWIFSLWIAYPFANLQKYIGLDLQPLGDIFLVGTMAYIIFQSFFVFKYLVKKDSTAIKSYKFRF